MSVEPAGRLEGRVHVFPVRVYYEDTDAAGLVYYANYLKFIERARTEMMRHLGFSHPALKEEFDAAFIVRRCAIDYREPARIDDLLEVHTRVLRLSGASMDALQIIKRGAAELVRIDLKIAWVSSKGRPVRLPGKVAEAFAPFVHKDQLEAKG
ncbi:MAG: tol-pal system-associated acyl-CoA thioesterase [Proteobacteria bacterium]|nr:tol-pal system-associated acyl-CoA thioesterase [Pseudomonadota bacterium]